MSLSLCLLSLLASLVLAHLLAKTSAFAFLAARGPRVGSLDGLRGFLALAVFFHHFSITYHWKQSGQWTAPPETVFENFGKVGVALFFMITGYLFTSKILQHDRIDWHKLYRSRVYRIVPLYLLAFLCVALIVAINTGFDMQVPASQLALDLLRWLTFHGSTINAYPFTRTIIAGVDWTLRHEWAFYLALPGIRWVMHRGPWATLALVLLTVALYLHPVKLVSLGSEHLVYFVVGAIPAWLTLRNKVPSFIRSRWVAMLLLLALAGALTTEHRGPIQLGLLAVAFIGMALGNNLFGLLVTRPAVLLGEISYSIYLLHGLVLYLLFTQFPLVDATGLSPLGFSWWMPLTSLVVTAMSASTYLLVEKRFIELGHKPVASRPSVRAPAQT